MIIRLLFFICGIIGIIIFGIRQIILYFKGCKAIMEIRPLIESRHKLRYLYESDEDDLTDEEKKIVQSPEFQRYKQVWPEIMNNIAWLIVSVFLLMIGLSS